MSGLDLVAVVCDTGLLVLIWLVQLVIYPSFREVDESRFREWHAVYSRRVSFVVIPLMFGQLGATIILCVRNAALLETIHLAAVLVAWLLTFLLAVPLHRRLGESDKDGLAIERLIRVNRLRTFAWSLIWAVGVGRL